MISIIICSRTKTISDRLFHNLDETIGCSYELIIIDNSKNEYSIFEAYNKGLEESKSEIVCFIHDDINILTKNWGAILMDIFSKNKNIGLVGVAGSKSKTKMPSAWWDSYKENLSMNIIQFFSDGKKTHWNEGFDYGDLQEVVAIDGVFMAAKKIESISFNTQLSGFHNYDMNLSLEYLKNEYSVMVTNKILLEHFSIGALDKSWCLSTLQIHKLYKELLPLSKSDHLLSKNIEFNNGVKFVTKLLEFNIKKPAFFLWLRLFQIKPFSKFHFYFLQKIFK